MSAEEQQYTTEFFLNFFSKIPTKRWTLGMGHRGGPRCALGHLGCDFTGDPRPNARALGEILRPVYEGSKFSGIGKSPNTVVSSINDDYTQICFKGKTPRARILNALRKAIRLRKGGKSDV